MKVRATIVLAFAASCSRSEAAPVERHVIAASDEPIAVASHDEDPIVVLARTNRACEACHPVHAKEWRASPHRNAFTDEAFATAYARTPFRFCRDCHAPHAKGLPDDARLDANSPAAWVADNGVACVTCHVPADDPTAVLSGTGATAPGTPHPVLRPASFADRRACAGCHEFQFPDAETPSAAADPMVVAATLMQRTLWEHERSPFADTSCATCHMPEVGDGADRHRDHRFAHSDERLRAALVATASRTHSDGTDRVVLELEPVGVGHAFPTGDLFRRLELKIESIDEGGNVIATQRRYLERHFAPRRRGQPHRRVQPLEPDDRLTGPTTFTFDVPHATSADVASVRWSVTYQRVDHRVAEAPERSTLHGETVLATGDL